MLTNPDIRFNEAQIKCYMQQLLEGLRYLHDVSPPPSCPRRRNF
jgi:serine/threonine-protein kinase BUR1